MEYKVTRDITGSFNFYESPDPTLYEWKEISISPVYEDLKRAIRLIETTTQVIDLNPYLGMIERVEWCEKLNEELKKFIQEMRFR